MTKLAAMPMYGKNLKTFIFSGTKRPMTMKIGTQQWVLEYYQVRSNDVPEMTLTCFMPRSNLVSYAFVWVKQWIFFSETVVVYYIKFGRCSQLNEYMKLYEYQRSRSFIDLDQKHSFNIFKLLFLNNC